MPDVFGFEIYRPDGTLNVSRGSVPGGIKDIFAIGAGSSGSKSYPDLAGYTVSVATVGSSFFFTTEYTYVAVASVSYSGDIPVVSWGGTSNVGATIYVFCK